MKKILLFLGFCLAVSMFIAGEDNMFASDRFPTSSGDLDITFIGHGSLILTWNQSVIHVDPFSDLTDYSKLPKADLILVTHDHSDHLDANAIAAIRGPQTAIIYSAKCSHQLPGGEVMANGDKKTWNRIEIEAVPAYNIRHKRPDGNPFHPQGEGNGYVLTLGGKRIYIAGDTECIPEMNARKNIDIAFLPMNLPYTMTPEMVAEGAKTFKPKILYPYHMGTTDPQKLIELLKNEKEIEIRIRHLQ